jgi:hypothetical protein
MIENSKWSRILKVTMAALGGRREEKRTNPKSGGEIKIHHRKSKEKKSSR